MDPSVHHRPLRHLFRTENALFTPGVLGISGHALIHLHHPFIFGAEMTWLNCKLRGIPYVVTYHSDLIGKGYRRPAFAIYQRFIVPLVLGGARKLLVTTMDYALASKIGSIVKERREDVSELPNGVDVESFHPRASHDGLRERYGLGEGDLVVLFVGALDRAHVFKGVDILLQALGRIPDPSVKALVVGEGELQRQYVRQASRLSLSGRVHFCGRVPMEELPAHYALCDCLVLPSTAMSEAFGVVLLEAMACAKPVIASNIPGVRTVVSDGEDGLLVRPGDVEDLRDKIEQLLNDSQLRREMGSRGRAKVEENYAWGPIARRLEQVYQQVLHG